MRLFFKTALVAALLGLFLADAEARPRNRNERNRGSDAAGSDMTPPADGSAVTPAADHSQVALSWDAADSSTDHYEVYFLTGGSGPNANCTNGSLVVSQAGTTYTHTGRTNGLVHRYRVCAVDLAGNKSTGIITNATPANEQTSDLDGTDDFCLTADNSVWSTGDISVCCWARAANLANNETISAQAGTTTTQIAHRFITRADGQVRVVVSGDGTTLATQATTSAGIMANNVFAHMCFAYNSDASPTLLIMKNGVTQASTTISGSLPTSLHNSTAGLTFGANADASTPFGAGFIDECSFWNVALTEANTASIYNGGVPISCTATGVSGCISEYWFGDLDTHPTVTDRVSARTCTMQNDSAFNTTPLP